MARALWPLHRGRPCIKVELTLLGGRPYALSLLADTGAGSSSAGFELLLHEDDCILGGGVPGSTVMLRGAYLGSFPTYELPVCIPTVGFNQKLRVVGLTSVPPGFDGIACFRLLNRFSYGSFGDPDVFGLER